MKIKHVTPQLLNIFPGARLWLRFPSFLGFCAISTGIFSGFSLVAFHVYASSLYTIIFKLSIVLLIVTALLSSSRFFRFFCLFLIGAFSGYLWGDEYDRVFGKSTREARFAETCLLYGSVLSVPAGINGEFSCIVRADSLISDRSYSAFSGKKYSVLLV
jgi:hypothetical protein